MSEEAAQGDSAPADHPQGCPPLDLEEQSTRTMNGLANLVERIAPWLFSMGSWIFGGAIALNLIVISSLLTVGPVDDAVLISIASFACALPVNLAGIFLLRLVKDTKDMAIDDLALRAFQAAGFPDIEAYFPPSQEKERQHQRRAMIALRYSAGMLTLSIASTVTGLVAALWHMAWWIGVVLLAMVVLSGVIVIVAIAHSLPPESDAEKELKRRYRQQRNQPREQQ